MRGIGRRLLVIVLFALSACAYEPTIRSDYDHAADFSRYRSFGFEPRLGTDTAGYDTLTTQRLKAAVTREMTARGYTHAEANPDLLVNFSARLQNKIDVNTTPVPMGYYGYRRGLYGPWPGYAMTTDVDQYTEGTLNIDLIDAARKEMVWEGVAVGEVTEREVSEETLNKVVAQIFAKYPFRAADGASPSVSMGN
jgi:hypothetical protein